MKQKRIIGKPLKREELEEGKIYWCRLSNRPVLVNEAREIKNSILRETIVYFNVEAISWYDGVYDEPEIYDHMLCEYEIKSV